MLRPFPRRAARDALGLVRLLWIDAHQLPDPERSTALTTIGETLADALRMGALDPDSLGYRAATTRAVEAMDALLALGWPGNIAELIRQARARIAGPPPPYVSATDRRKARQQLRG
ncbi:MAG: hypothetical protein U0359_10855 [Byssovorax sp.]